MLRLTVGIEDYIQINEDIKIIFLGGSQKNMRVMIDAPKEVKIARGKAIKKRLEEKASQQVLTGLFWTEDTGRGPLLKQKKQISLYIFIDL